MKSPFILTVSLAAVSLLSISSANAQTIADWTFENAPLSGNVTGTTPGTLIPAIISNGVNASGSATGLHASAATVWNNLARNGSTDSLSSNTWTTGDYYQFTLTLNDNELSGKGLSIAFDQTGSNT